MTNKLLQKSLLLIMAIGLVPIALGYGFMPEKTLTLLYGFDVSNVNLKHIMRAVMGIYFGQIIIWTLGFSKPSLRRPAMHCLVVFVLGVAGGRMISFIIDGMSHWSFTVYLILELIIGLFGLNLIVTEKKAQLKRFPNL